MSVFIWFNFEIKSGFMPSGIFLFIPAAQITNVDSIMAASFNKTWEPLYSFTMVLNITVTHVFSKYYFFKIFINSFAAGSEDAGFCPVMSMPSFTT